MAKFFDSAAARLDCRLLLRKRTFFRGAKDDTVTNHKVVGIERRSHAADVAVAVDERVVDRAVPTGGQLAGELFWICFALRREQPRVRLRLQVERQLDLIPLAHDQRADRFPRVPAATEELAAVEEQLDRRRVARSVPEVVPPRAVAARVLARTPEIKAGVKPPFFVRLDVGDRSAEAVVLTAVRHVDAEFPRREGVEKRAL